MSVVFVLCLFAAVYFGSAFTPGLQDDADATHAEAAREMYVTHDFVTLKINGNRYLEKAPLMYWLIASSYAVFGVNEFAARVPTMLAILGLTLLAMKWGRRAFGDRAAIYAGMFVATTVGYYLFSRVLIPEAVLSLFIAGSFYCFLTALEDGKPWQWYGGYACLALAVLTKGLLALVVVGFAMLLFLAVSGEWRRWREFHIATGLLLFFAIATPWHVLAGIRNPHFFWFYFVNEHFMRFLGKRIPKDYNKQENSLYWTLHMVWLFPWSLYLPIALRRPIVDWMARRKQGAVRAKSPAHFPHANAPGMFHLGGGDAGFLFLLHQSGVLHLSCILSDPAADCGGTGQRRESRAQALVAVDLRRDGFDRHCSHRSADGRPVEFAASAFRSGHRHGAGQA